MGVTIVPARIIGEAETRDYNFMIDTGSTYVGLPLEEIEALELRPSGGRVRLMSATGMVEVPTYYASGELMGLRFGAIAVPASTPLIGYELLENLRFRVNPVTQEIEPAPDGEFHPPFQL